MTDFFFQLPSCKNPASGEWCSEAHLALIGQKSWLLAWASAAIGVLMRGRPFPSQPLQLSWLWNTEISFPPFFFFFFFFFSVGHHRELEHFRVATWIISGRLLSGERLCRSGVLTFCHNFLILVGSCQIRQGVWMQSSSCRWHWGRRQAWKPRLLRGCTKWHSDLHVCKETCVAEECSLSFALTLVSSGFIPEAVTAKFIRQYDFLCVLFCFEQLSGSVPRLQAERHQYAEKRKEVRRMWQQ